MKNKIIVLGFPIMSCQEVGEALERLHEATTLSINELKENMEQVSKKFEDASKFDFKKFNDISNEFNEKIIFNDLKNNKDKIYSGLKKYRNVRRF